MNIDPAWLAPSYFLDYQTPRVQDFVAKAVGDAQSPRDKAVRLYHAVRDGVRYDPYRFRIEREWFQASHVLAEGAAYCVPKALLYCACLRCVGIPARPGFADVRNHLATERLLKLSGTDIFTWHGYVSLLLDGEWIKATPVFNIEMCARFQVLPLEFDGRADSLMQPYDARNQRHMEYINYHGEFDDLPYEQLTAEMRRGYAGLIAAALQNQPGAFEREAIHQG